MGVNKASEARNTLYKRYFWTIGMSNSESCTLIKDIENASKRKTNRIPTVEMPKLRPQETLFTYNDHCFLCGTEPILIYISGAKLGSPNFAYFSMRATL